MGKLDRMSASLALLFAAAALAMLPGVARAGSASVDSQGNLFVQTGTVEFGASANGHFGSCYLEQCASAPAGYHANSSGLGFISVRNLSAPSWLTTFGDFFIPGDPYEAWVLTADGFKGENSNSSTSIPGAWATTSSSASSWVWSSTEPWHGLSVTQTVTQPAGTSQVNVAVQLTNTTSAPIEGVAYGRAIDPDNCAVKDEDFDTTNQVLAQMPLSEGKSVVTASKTCDPLGVPYETVMGLWSKDAGAVVNNDVTDFDPAYDLASDPIASGESVDADSGIAVSIPGKPSSGDTLAPGASVTLRFSYALSAADIGSLGLDVPDPILKSASADVTYKAMLTKYLAFVVGGSAGRTYEVSTASAFTSAVTYASGAAAKVKLTSSSFVKGKVGRTTLYVRDKLIPSKSFTFSMPWDFSIPTVKSGTVRPARDSGGKVIPGRWTLGFVAADTKPVGSTRGLWATLSFSTSTPSSTAPVPTALVADSVLAVSGSTYVVNRPTVPRWVRVSDEAGNKSTWLRLTQLS